MVPGRCYRQSPRGGGRCRAAGAPAVNGYTIGHSNGHVSTKPNGSTHGSGGDSESSGGRSANGARVHMHQGGMPLVSLTSSGMVSPAGETVTAPGPIPQLNHKFERTCKALSLSPAPTSPSMLSFSKMASLLVNMSLLAKVAVVVPLRTAIWNWINLFPSEFHDALRVHRCLEGAPECVFDGLWDPQAMDLVSARALWPTLAVLSIISPERTVPDYYQLDAHSGAIKGTAARFMHQLQKSAHSSSKARDVAIICLLDICRGAAQQLALDIVHDIRTILVKCENQRPFWESQGKIDVAMFADALVAVFRFVSAKESLPLFATCFGPKQSDAIKLVAVKACIMLAVKAKSIDGQPDLTELAELVTPRACNIVKVCGTDPSQSDPFSSARYSAVRRNEIDKNGNLRRAALHPKAKKFTAEAVSDRELLAIAVMHSWKAAIAFLFTGLSAEEAQEWVPMCFQVWEQQTDASIQYSIAVAFNQVTLHVHALMPGDYLWDTTIEWKLLISSTCTAANGLLNLRMEPDKQRMWAEIGHSYTMVYIEPSGMDTVLHLVQTSELRVPALALLELSMAVALSSADPHVSRLATHSLRVLAIGERGPRAPRNAFLSHLAWQKRVRHLYSTLTMPHPYFVVIWEECYYQWCALTELVIQAPMDRLKNDESRRSTGDRLWTIDEQKHQWQNLTLFLAACGGACLEETHDPYALQEIIPAELPLDAMRVLKDPRELITFFIQYLIDMLLTDLVMAWETAKGALGSELRVSYRLHGKLLKHLDERDITCRENFEWNDQFAIFLDQFITVLKLLSENTQSKDELLTVNVMPTLYTLAGFINRFSGSEAQHVRIKFCVLCDSLFAWPDMLSMRKDGNLHQNVLDILIDW
ncbi:hypothetical protein K488DRAFT_92404, partial [Vararia minispora EC-137]